MRASGYLGIRQRNPVISVLVLGLVVAACEFGWSNGQVAASGSTKTASHEGLNITAQAAEEFFSAAGLPVRWVPGNPTRDGPEILGVSTKPTCVITLDGPASDLQEIGVGCRSARGAAIEPQVSGYEIATVARLSGAKAARWLTHQLTVATHTLNRSHLAQTPRKYRSATTETTLGVAMLVGTVRAVSVFTTAKGVKPLSASERRLP